MNENDCEKNGIEIFRDRFFDYFLNIQAKRILTKKRMKMSKVWSVPSKKKGERKRKCSLNIYSVIENENVSEYRKTI